MVVKPETTSYIETVKSTSNIKFISEESVKPHKQEADLMMGMFRSAASNICSKVDYTSLRKKGMHTAERDKRLYITSIIY